MLITLPEHVLHSVRKIPLPLPTRSKKSVYTCAHLATTDIYKIGHVSYRVL